MRRASPALGFSLLALPLLAGFTCGHPEGPGPYTFAADQLLQDRCGLVTDPGRVATGTLTVIGDGARIDDFAYAGATFELVGRFQEESNAFYLDGSASNLTLPLDGGSCLADLVNIDLTGAPDGGPGFGGNLRIQVTALHDAACQCEAELTYRAVP